ncbi:MAG: DUF2971 domain-containing protein [Phycisphaerae bacterium]|nr:DUF2971 domain-containing protein [Phycisphaerae bacterium]
MTEKKNSKSESKEPSVPLNREQHLKQTKKLMESFSESYDKLIYHYTSESIFQKIVKSGEIHLTNTEFVNDTTECKALQKEINLFGKGELSSNRYIEKWWQQFLKNKNDNTNFVASFSKNPDSLEQWRAYGDICIGFDARRLRKPGFSLYECVYCKNEIKELILKVLKTAGWMLDDPDRTRQYIAENGIRTTSYDDARDGAAFYLMFEISRRLKHPCYVNEEEVRLMVSSNQHWNFPNSPSMYDNDPPIHFRQHQGFEVPVPYVKYFTTTEPEDECDSSEKYKGKTEHQIKEEKREKEKNQKRALLPIKEIWVGPTSHKEKTRLACEILLQEKGYKDVPVNISELPYRGF